MTDAPDDPFDGEPVEIPIDGNLDLHPFLPKEIKPLLEEYLGACRDKGILQVRLIHGKGTGALKRSVESIVSKIPYVLRSWPADERDGGWGATWVALRPPETDRAP